MPRAAARRGKDGGRRTSGRLCDRPPLSRVIDRRPCSRCTRLGRMMQCVNRTTHEDTLDVMLTRIVLADTAVRGRAAPLRA
jgi:hypothetical protein